MDDLDGLTDLYNNYWLKYKLDELYPHTYKKYSWGKHYSYFSTILYYAYAQARKEKYK